MGDSEPQWSLHRIGGQLELVVQHRGRRHTYRRSDLDALDHEFPGIAEAVKPMFNKRALLAAVGQN